MSRSGLPPSRWRVLWITTCSVRTALQSPRERSSGIRNLSGDKLAASAARMQHILEQNGIESAVVGAVAVGVWGAPRKDRELDLKVLVGRDQAQRLVAALPQDFRPLGGEPLDLLQTHGMLFGQDGDGTRIGLLLSEVPFDREAILNGVYVESLDARTVTPEVLVVYKILGGRAADIEDALSVVRRQNRLDREYIRRWLAKFEGALDDGTLLETLEELLGQA